MRCRGSTQYIPQKNMKSATGFFWIVLCNLPLVRINCVNETPWQFIFFFGTHCVPSGFFSLCVRNSFLLRFFVRNSFFALSLRENCLVARCVRKLTYKVLVIQCIIIRRCIFGRFICICRLVCVVTKEWICC